MQTNTRNAMIISTAAFALTAASMMDFVEGYNLPLEVSGNSILVFRGKETYEIKLNTLEYGAKEKLNGFFHWLNPNDVDGVIADWNLHVIREESINEAPEAKSEAGQDEEFTPGTREHAIFEKSLED